MKGNKSYSDEAVEFATEILDTINDVKDNFECDFTFNLEMIPAENCAGVICTADNLLFEQNKYFIYSNQWIPLMEKCTIQEKCRLGSLFEPSVVVAVSPILILRAVSPMKRPHGICSTM